MDVRKGIRSAKKPCQHIMTSRENLTPNTARAYPVSDAQGPRLTPARSQQGLPSRGRTRPKKLAQCMRVGTLNVGSMTGRGRELADFMERRRVDVLCVQETRWKGNKARELGTGFKLIYSSASKEGRNGIGIVLSKTLKNCLVSVRRKE